MFQRGVESDPNVIPLAHLKDIPTATRTLQTLNTYRLNRVFWIHSWRYGANYKVLLINLVTS
jgi:hypothetical protein